MQIAVQGPYQVVERSAATFTANFRDDAGAGVTPTNAYWRIDNENGCQIQGWTEQPIEAEATSVSIPVSSELNAVQNFARQLERRTLTVMTDRNLSTQFASAFQFDVKNLGWLS